MQQDSIFSVISLEMWQLCYRRYFPKPDGVVLSLLGANVTVFILWIVADPTFMRKNFMVSTRISFLFSEYNLYLLTMLIFNGQISLDNFKSGHLHTLLTSAFSHSNPGHLLRNMAGLCIFGTNVGLPFKYSRLL